MRRKADERREVSADDSLFQAAAVAERVAVACCLLLASRAGFHYPQPPSFHYLSE